MLISLLHVYRLVGSNTEGRINANTISGTARYAYR
jgi:hypothetical protein